MMFCCSFWTKRTELAYHDTLMLPLTVYRSYLLTLIRTSAPKTIQSFPHPSFRKMTSDHIHASIIYLEPINRNFHLSALIIIVHIPNRHSAFFIKHCPILAYLAIFITSKSSVILSRAIGICAIKVPSIY